MSYGIVREHGGEISHEEPEGPGACFVVRVPAADGALPAGAEPRSTVERARRSGRVLVVDDEAVMRRVVGTCLGFLGHDCLALPSAEGVDAELARAEFDLALVDLRMPGVDGAELCARLRRDYPQLTVVAMSGFVTDEAREQLSLAGIDEVLDKPFDVDTLERVVGEALGPGEPL